MGSDGGGRKVITKAVIYSNNNYRDKEGGVRKGSVCVGEGGRIYSTVTDFARLRGQST